MAATHPQPARRALKGALAALLVVPLAAGCAESTGTVGTTTSDSGSSAPDSPAPDSPAPVSAVKVRSNVARGADGVQVSRMVKLEASKGTFRTVKVHTTKGESVPGGLSSDRTAWHATGRLEPSQDYLVRAVAADSNGTARSYSSRFSTQDLSLKQQTYPSVSPLGGQTVGVGMPIMIHFDVPVQNRTQFEQHMHVTSSAGQKGSFSWLDSQNVHYRPEHYWKPGSKISVNIDVNSVDAGNGIYGQESRNISFDVGHSMVSKVNLKTDQLKAYRDGKLVRTIPVTGGMPGFTTRSGTKVIVAKDRLHDMNSETIGLDPNGPNGYNLKGVEYAMRLTFSGEFLHAAPWSVGSQGRANVSHGCTGMSTANAGWLFNNTMVGDPVEYTGTDRYMTLTNGYGDWNQSWADWKAGSAL
ncbi:MAG: Ig-like domain-containing protein [Marmoricola sp.]